MWFTYLHAKEEKTLLKQSFVWHLSLSLSLSLSHVPMHSRGHSFSTIVLSLPQRINMISVPISASDYPVSFIYQPLCQSKLCAI